MGANKKSRFHGKDPRYKNRDRTTLVEIAPIAAIAWEDEADRFLADRALNDWKVTAPSGRRTDFCKVAPEPELEDVVKRFLAKRDLAIKQETQPTAVDRLNAEYLHAPERVRLEAPLGMNDVQQTAPRNHDILLQLFSERKISLGHFHAGRRWQWDREAATVQPVTSIDWSQSSPNPYQLDGELTERQWAAIRNRKRFITHAGLTACTMLDFCLEVDRGRSELMQLTKLPAVRIECVVEELLDKVCECFA